VFSVSPRAARQAAEQIDPTPETLLPALGHAYDGAVGVAPLPPAHALYAGAYDRRVAASELALLAGMLRAAAGHGLRIHDAGWHVQGALAASLQLPPDLQAFRRRPLPPAAEAEAIRAAGLVLCSHPVPRPDFPSFALLRALAALAAGAHVVSTPADTGDALLSRAVAFAGSDDAAAAAVSRLARTPRLDAESSAAREQIVAAYGLGQRLEVIARHFRIGPVAVAAPVPAAVETAA
jgi:hypothetical protein